MSAASCLYLGAVMHRRLRPRVHRLRYRVFWMLLDLDSIDELDRRLRLFSRNGFNAVSFRDTDHGDGGSDNLRSQVERHLGQAGITPDGGRITLLCMPRIFGYGFNPLSVYFCYARDGALQAILYEVHNTFRERHSYLVRVPKAHGQQIDQHCDKNFYVSPFMDMAMTYAFRVGLPGDRVSVRIEGSDSNGPMIVAALTGRRMALTDATLLRALLVYPLLTLKVVAAIHWHALRMVLRGFQMYRRPPPPAHPVSTGVAGPSPK